MESFRQALGAVYFALAEAAGGSEVLDRASDILTDAVASGAIDDPLARAAVLALVRSGALEISTIDGRFDSLRGSCGTQG